MRPRLYAFLDSQVFPRLVGYISSREHIVTILLVMLALMFPSTPMVLVLIVNSYLNSMSVATGSIIARTQNDHHDEVLGHHEGHAASLDDILARLEGIEARLSEKSTACRLMTSGSMMIPSQATPTRATP